MPKSIDKKEHIPVKFQIKGIDVLDFCLNRPQSIMPQLKQFQFDIKLEHKLNIDAKFLAVVISIEIFDEPHEIKYGDFSMSCNYEIENINEFIDSKNNLVFPEDFIIAVNSISISTTRGMMFSQFKGTFLHVACLPIIDPKTFVLQK